MSDTLYLLTGPTAVGKTELSLQWAQANDAEILSCDSTLFYKDMNIGTAKPSAEELARIKHHGIDIVPVYQPFNISDYITYAKKIVEDIYTRGKKVLITGGSGFYLKAFLDPVVDNIKVPDAINQKVLDLYNNQGLPGLLDVLTKASPDGLGSLDVQNPRRVIKALGRCLATGKSVLEIKESFDLQSTPFDSFNKKIVILERNRDVLKDRIEKRVLKMLEIGLIDEVHYLIQQGIMSNPSAASAIGYAETLDWLKNGSDNKEVLAKAIILNTNKLVAKQRKWFRKQIKNARTINL